MYSPESKIMTAHFIVLNPFLIQEPKGKKDAQTPQVAMPFPCTQGDINEQEMVSSLKAFTVQRQKQFYEGEAEVEDKILNRVSCQS